MDRRSAVTGGPEVASARNRSAVAVICSDQRFSARAEELAEQLNLPLTSSPEQHLLLLNVNRNGLELIKPDDPDLRGPVRADFISGQAVFRRKQRKKELLLRAVGRTGKTAPTVIDGTGGLGRDSFILADAGCRVQVFERHPIIAALLADGLERAAVHPETAEIVSRIRLTGEDVTETLQKMREHGEQADVIYLDPMFPSRRKSALVKKELRILQLLAGIDSDPEQLLTAAIRTAAERVVVKRPIKAPVLAGLSPSYALKGKIVRFDVYIALSR